MFFASGRRCEESAGDAHFSPMKTRLSAFIATVVLLGLFGLAPGFTARALGAEDLDIRNLAVGKAATTNGGTTVTVSFTNFGKKQTAKFDLVQEDGAWKISDIHYADGSALLKLFRDAGVKR